MPVDLSLRLAGVAVVSFLAIVLVAGAVRRHVVWRRLARAADRSEALWSDAPSVVAAVAMPGGSCRFDWDLASGGIAFGPCWDAGSADAASALPGAPRLERWAQVCHPDDLPLLQAGLSEHFAGRSERVACELRVRASRDEWRWVLLQGQLAGAGPDGRAERMVGLLVDVDASRRERDTFAGQRRVLESAGVLAFSFAAEAPHLLVESVEAMDPGIGDAVDSPQSGAEPVAGQGSARRSLGDMTGTPAPEAVAECIAQALRQPEKPAEAELRLPAGTGEGTWMRFRVLASLADGDGLLHGCLIPIEEEKRAQAFAAERQGQLERVVLKSGETQRFLEGLQHMTELLQLSENESDGQQVVSQAGRHLFPRWQGWVTVAGDLGEMTVVSQWGGDGGSDALVAEGQEADCWAVRRGRLHHVAGEGRVRDSGPACAHFGHGAALPPGVTHTVCVPFSMPPDRHAALHLVATEPIEEDDLYATFWRAETMVEAVEMSLANLHLRITLREQAERDGMTGLFNRRYFDDVLRREVSRAKRSNSKLTLALLDIDRFKSFNDAFGHEAGDAVIKAVAEQLLGFVRSYDVACRIGGEELAVLMSHAALQDACARLDRLREQVASRMLRHKDVELPPVTISIGVASLENDDAEELLRRADGALYASKDAGRNRVTCWTGEMESSARGSGESSARGSGEALAPGGVELSPEQRALQRFSE